MPTSPHRNIQTIIDIVLDLHPRPTRVLDVGFGYGKFGLLCKEYLGYWNSPSQSRLVSVDGIEAFPNYVGVIQRAIYDRIFIGNALDILPQFGADSYDLVLLVDVLEHFSRAEGKKSSPNVDALDVSLL